MGTELAYLVVRMLSEFRQSISTLIQTRLMDNHYIFMPLLLMRRAQV